MTATSPSRRPRRRLAAIAGLCAFLVCAGPLVANAVWSAATSLGGTVTVATVGVGVTGHSALSTQYKFAGAAGNSPVVIAPLPVTNTGTAPLNLTVGVSGVSGNALAPLVDVTLWRSATATCSATIPATGTTAGTLAAMPALPGAATVVAAGAGFTLCVATRLNSTVAASQGLTVSPVFTILGTVGTSTWTSSAAGTFTQDVYRMVDPTGLTCTEIGSAWFSRNVSLSWNAPTGTGTTGAISYRIVNADTNAVIETGITKTKVTITPGDLAATTTLLIQAEESQYGSTSVGVPIQLTRGADSPPSTLSCP